MYTFIQAIAVKHGYNERWTQVDIAAMPANTLFTKYRQIYAVLTQPTILEPLSLDLGLIADKLQSYTGTISDYLSSIGNDALPTVMGTPTITRNTAVYSDAFQADFTVEPVDSRLGEGVVVPEEDRPDLLLTKTVGIDTLDYFGFQKKVLPIVNGFYHRPTANSRGYYIHEGNKTARRSSQNHVGLVSFGTFGDMTYLEIPESIIHVELKRESTEVDQLHLNFGNDAFKGKTPILIMGGYMILIDGETLSTTINGVLTFNPRKYPIIERYFESKKYLDYSEFPIIKNPDNEDWLHVASLKTEAFYRKLLAMPQSFVVLVDTEHLIAEKEYPERQTVPNTYMSYKMPKWPLVVCEGKHEVYWNQYESNSWTLTCGDTYKRHYMYQTTPLGLLVAVDDSLVLADAGRYSFGYFLKLTDEEVEIRV